MIDDTQILGNHNVADWAGSAYLHLVVESKWSVEFEGWLLDRSLFPSLNPNLMVESSVQEVLRRQKVCVEMQELPDWSIDVGQPFSCHAELLWKFDERIVRIPNKHSVWPVGFVAEGHSLNFVHFFAGAFNG